jgi:hypothetical protein
VGERDGAGESMKVVDNPTDSLIGSNLCVGCLKNEKIQFAHAVVNGFSLCMPCFKEVIRTDEFPLPANLDWFPTNEQRDSFN